MTPFSKRCEILSELWLNYRDNETFEEFIEYNDLGLPMAHLIAENLVEATRQGEIYIDETFELLLNVLSIEDDNYDSLAEMLEKLD